MTALPSTLLLVLTSVAGGVGAALRLVVDGRINARSRLALPVGTLTINVTGSLVLGILTGAAAGPYLSSTILTIAGTGLMGGYTTFSTASFETVRLVRSGSWLRGLLNGLGMLVASVATSALGIWLGALL